LTQLVVAALGFVAAVLYAGPLALRAAAAIGLPTDESAGSALALACASAAVWAMFCPLAVWMGGRPARLGKREVLRLFAEPWIASVPMIAALLGAWNLLLDIAGPTSANLVTVVVLAPCAAAGAMWACIRIRPATRADVAQLASRFLQRLRGRDRPTATTP
jgi:hypothetical protein